MLGLKFNGTTHLQAPFAGKVTNTSTERFKTLYAEDNERGFTLKSINIFFYFVRFFFFF